MGLLTAEGRRATSWRRMTTIHLIMISNLPIPELHLLAQLTRSLPTEMPDFSCWSHQPQLSQQQQPQHSPLIQEHSVYLCLALPLFQQLMVLLPVVNKQTVMLTSHIMLTVTCYTLRCYC